MNRIFTSGPSAPIQHMIASEVTAVRILSKADLLCIAISNMMEIFINQIFELVKSISLREVTLQFIMCKPKLSI